jgi:hypothetical protein
VIDPGRLRTGALVLTVSITLTYWLLVLIAGVVR